MIKIPFEEIKCLHDTKSQIVTVLNCGRHLLKGQSNTSEVIKSNHYYNEDKDYINQNYNSERK